MRKKLLFTICLAIPVICTTGLFACTTQSNDATTSAPTANSTSAPPSIQEPVLPTIAELVTKVKPSVVSINVEITTYDFFNQPVKEEGAGSGWIIEGDGYIVTNNHVVEGADSVTVILSDGSMFLAEDIKADPLTDLAVVQIDAHNLPVLDTGDSSLLEVGDWVVAVGNALGMGISATFGIVSAVDVSLSESADQTVHGLIQTDAAINPGNSGGPLVNVAGEVIGINSIKIAQVGVESMGYAISINAAMPIIRELINTGYIVRPWLGIGQVTINEMIASFYNLAVDTGVLVTEVTPGSPADKAGLKAGDVITAIDDEEVSSAGDLVQLINSYKVGQKVEISFWRGQTQNSASLTLGESPPPGS